MSTHPIHSNPFIEDDFNEKPQGYLLSEDPNVLDLDIQKFYPEQSLNIVQDRLQNQSIKKQAFDQYQSDFFEDDFSNNNILKLEQQAKFVCDDLEEYLFPSLQGQQAKREIMDEERPQTIEEHIAFLEDKICLRTTSLQDISGYIQENFNIGELKQDSYDRIIHAVIKRKMILKREKAKKRRNEVSYQQPIQDSSPKIEDTEEEKPRAKGKRNRRQPGSGPVQIVVDQDKRKRNRISAQVSRDRRKMYLVELQKNNQRLKQEYDQVQLQNEKLKKELQAYQKSQQAPKAKPKAEAPHKFMKLLVFLGILFMMTVMKDFFGGNSTKQISKSLVLEEAEQIDRKIQSRSLANQSFQQLELEVLPEQEKNEIVEQTTLMLVQQMSKITLSQTFHEQQKVRRGSGRMSALKSPYGKKLRNIQEPELIEQSKAITMLPLGAATNIGMSGDMMKFLMNKIPNPKNGIILPKKVIEGLKGARKYFDSYA